MQVEKFDIWAMIELFGHTRIAGRVSEKNIGGASFLQVDVPENKINPAFTRMLNPSAIYAINPVTEEVARHYAENLNVKPIDSWDINKFLEKAKQNQIAQKAVTVDENEEDDDDDRSWPEDRD